jgi:uncharacterized protein (DUF1330 family)
MPSAARRSAAQARKAQVTPLTGRPATNRSSMAHRWYGSEDYRDLKEMRLAATRSDVVFMEGVMDGFR